MVSSETSGLSIQAFEFLSATKHTGAAIIVVQIKYVNVTNSSAGYNFITWVCKVIWNLNSLYFLHIFNNLGIQKLTLCSMLEGLAFEDKTCTWRIYHIEKRRYSAANKSPPTTQFVFDVSKGFWSLMDGVGDAEDSNIGPL